MTVQKLLRGGAMTAILIGFTSTAAIAAEKPTATKVNWKSTYRQAFDAVKKEKKPMLVHVGAEWCHTCHLMLSETYREQKVIARVNQDFIPVQLDADKDAALIEQIGVGAYPTTVVISTDLKIVKKLTGYQSADELKKQLKLQTPSEMKTASTSR